VVFSSLILIFHFLAQDSILLDMIVNFGMQYQKYYLTKVSSAITTNEAKKVWLVVGISAVKIL
jgi:hypothetical protein